MNRNLDIDAVVSRGDAPSRFYLDGRRVKVTEVRYHWLERGQRCFQVIGDDGVSYLLRHCWASNRWTLSPTMQGAGTGGH
ncbi:hypothetical protein [Alkalilimnicola ehrlichii]|uniref:hypothetical protein n=1 Tax=Alkalilimnicola ehrlichii TaxID=351052 RepID=UPI0011C04972|nr:hypothetical protein [Alkalilimnicola ehrlichii]